MIPQKKLSIGEPVPDFSLPGIDGATHALSAHRGDKKAIVVMFICNHCPYVQSYEDRLIAMQREYAGRGVQFLGINSNDDSRYPEDSFEEMVARAQMKGYNFPYLRDDTQETARAYHAVCTPEVFVVDQDLVLRYHGRIDDDREGENITSPDLRNALDALLEGRPVPVPETRAFGCSIKWK